MMEANAPPPMRRPYPGLHPGTGTNDHIHHWEQYRGGVAACQICGKKKETP